MDASKENGVGENGKKRRFLTKTDIIITED